LVIAVPVAAKQGKTKQTRVPDKSGALSVAVPSGWQASDTEFMGAKLFLLGPEYEGFRININLATEAVGPTSLSEYTRVTEANLPKLIAEYEPVSKRPTKLGGIPATELVYRAWHSSRRCSSGPCSPSDTRRPTSSPTPPPAAFDKQVVERATW
jgi:hypothetical protein